MTLPPVTRQEVLHYCRTCLRDLRKLRPSISPTLYVEQRAYYLEQAAYFRRGVVRSNA